MKISLLLLLTFTTMQIEGQIVDASATSETLNSKSINLNENNSAQILSHLFKKKRAKNTQPFRVKSNSSSYEKDYNENFVRLIENFLLKHLKKIISQQKGSLSVVAENGAENSEATTDNKEFAYKYFQALKSKYTTKLVHSSKLTTQAAVTTANSTNVEILFTLHNKFKNCDLNSSENATVQAIVKCETLRKENKNHVEIVTTSRPTKLQKINLFLSSTSKAYVQGEKSYNDLKQVVVFYKRNFSYFVSALIILSTISIVLLIITFTCCAIVCKQRSSLNAYNDNEFFTYYNRNLPIIASVSSLSLSANANDRLDRLTDKADSGNRMMYDVNATSSKEALISNIGSKRYFISYKVIFGFFI